MSNVHQSKESSAREIVITRLFDAPPELVFNAWTNPSQMA
jgi:uncharacterized protein YndB with AHSA1/START domain